MSRNKQIFKRLNWIMVFVYLVTVILFGIQSFRAQDIEGMVQTLISPLMLLIPPLAYKLFRIKRMEDLTFLIYLFCYLAYALGIVGSLYRTTEYFDKVMHILAGVFFCFIGFGAYYYLKHNRRIEKKKDYRLATVFAFSFSMAIGALWEMMEYIADTFFGMNVQHVPETGVNDTMLDIYACFFGALFFVVLMYIYLKKDKQIYPCTIIEEFVEIMEKEQ